MIRLYILSALCLLVGMQGCEKELSGARYDSTDQLQIMDYIDSREDLSVFRQLVDAVGQRNLLKTAGAYTVFVPSNEAFQRLFTELSEEGQAIRSIADATPEFWLDYFRYHLLDRKVNTNEFAHGPLPYPTVYREKYILADISESYAAIRLNNRATIKEYNIELTNGYVNIVDDVLLPPTKSIYDALKASGKYSIMLGLMEAHGYDDYLKDSTVTLLIESDDALQRSGFSIDAIENTEDWLKYHIIPDSGYFLNLLTAQRFYSLYPDEALSFQVDEFGQYYVNFDYRFNQSRDFGIDKVCSNGIYHTLDTLLEIVEARPTTIRLNLYPPGSPYGAQNVFTQPPARILLNTGTRSYHQNQEFRITQFDATQVGDYFWMTVPDVPTGNYRIRIMHRAGAARGRYLTIYNDEIVKEDIVMSRQDGTFEEWDYLVYNYCGDINVEERGDVTLYFAFTGFGSNPNPSYCCDLLMDILELIPIN
ncbi:Uncaracterized surface protein containing fasciclin (FAS1) repeats [Parapedobacter composti]|uniref:Uncaracterized surface protein containing fasciclin (FAS1) repeats n=1 Tax=Parapedobacter composti TaxID=623281 RepID=A0A1I1K054_9SPHI|nr:fasciclin domain-containing protein [Parapedobacter composti]SFC52118.1 Uncaracterized surface protein containing fasciclin (FAS1) repeats [Parapedobacter composti]